MTLATRASFTGPIPDAPARNPLEPSLSLTGTKSGSNPTFAFDAVPESIVKVGSTYWCSYQTWADTDYKVMLASASSPAGPWTAYEGNPVLENGDQSWETDPLKIYAPEIMQHDGTFYIFYSATNYSTGLGGGIGVASASAVTGPYTKYSGNPLLTAATGWSSNRIGEPSVMVRDGLWVMAYMGETGTFGQGEKVGIATATSPFGPWTRAPNDPLLDFGAGGQWDDSLVADPHILWANGRYWMLYTGGPDAASTQLGLGLAYATDPLGPWTRHTSNPIITVGGSSAFDERFAFRGSLWFEDGVLHGVYAGFTPGPGSTARGGNFIISRS